MVKRSTRTRLNRGIRHVYAPTNSGITSTFHHSCDFGMRFICAVGLLASGQIRADFLRQIRSVCFTSISKRSPEPSLSAPSFNLEIEKVVRANLGEGEARGVVAYAGQQFTETEPLRGSHRGQVLVGLSLMVVKSPISLTRCVSCSCGARSVS